MDDKFSFFRSVFWPIHRSEAKKVLSMLLLMGLLCVCYSVLRNIKDTVILTAPGSGAEVLPFVKVWGILPGAILFTWIYTKLRSRFSREKVFYLIIGGFISYFLIFAFLLYPNSETLNFHQTAELLREKLPAGFSGLIAMMCNWTSTSFYIVAEMWSVVVLAILFWSFANDISPLSQARRSYGLLNIGSNLAPIIGGVLAGYVTKHFFISTGGLEGDHWHFTLIKLMVLISFFGIAAMGVFYWINRKIVPNDPHAKDGHSESVKNSKKGRLSLRDCIRYIAKSKYLTCIALIVLGYSIAVNFTDVLWKEQLKKHFSDPAALYSHMNQVTIGIGCFATLGGLFFSFLLRKLGWTFVAIITPAVMVLMAIGFFGFLFFESALTGIAMTLFSTTPLVMTVYFGSLQNCLSKAGKYSVFDASKELAFLAVDSESRLRGKAAIDGLGAGIGKSGSSITYQALILGLGGIQLSTPYIATILMAVFAAWIYSVLFVSKEFKTRSEAVVAEGLEREAPLEASLIAEEVVS